jgi:hypothetical protein
MKGGCRITREAIEFHFCPACGCVADWRAQLTDPEGHRRIAVNLRLAEPEAVARIPIDHFDGLNAFEDLPRDGRCVADYWFQRGNGRGAARPLARAERRRHATPGPRLIPRRALPVVAGRSAPTSGLLASGAKCDNTFAVNPRVRCSTPSSSQAQSCSMPDCGISNIFSSMQED